VKETFWLGIDCGGTYLKAGLYNSQGNELALNASPLPPSARAGLRRTRHAPALAALRGTIRLLQRPVCGEQIKGVAFPLRAKGCFFSIKRISRWATPSSLPIAGRWRSSALAAGRHSRKLYPLRARRCGPGIRPRCCAGSKRMSRSVTRKLAA
jgi:hypothetical protein